MRHASLAADIEERYRQRQISHGEQRRRVGMRISSGEGGVVIAIVVPGLAKVDVFELGTQRWDIGRTPAMTFQAGVVIVKITG